MSRKRNMVGIILVSLLFSVLIIGSSFYIADDSLRNTMTMILIAIWWVPYSLYSCTQPKKNCKPPATIHDKT